MRFSKERDKESSKSSKKSDKSEKSLENKLKLSDYSNEQVLEQDKVLAKNATRRFGQNVQLNRCESSQLVRLIAMALFIMIIPFQLFFMGSLQKKEEY